MFDVTIFAAIPDHDRADELRREADARRLAGRTRLRRRRPRGLRSS